MPDKKEGANHEDRDQQKTILEKLFSKPSQDKDFVPDLKAQWAELDAPGRVKFVLGVIIGLTLFLGGLLLAYLALSALVG